MSERRLTREQVLIQPWALEAFRAAIHDEAETLIAAGYDPSDPPWYPLICDGHLFLRIDLPGGETLTHHVPDTRDWALRRTP